VICRGSYEWRLTNCSDEAKLAEMLTEVRSVARQLLLVESVSAVPPVARQYCEKLMPPRRNCRGQL